eukprot:g4238.t1
MDLYEESLKKYLGEKIEEKKKPTIKESISRITKPTASSMGRSLHIREEKLSRGPMTLPRYGTMNFSKYHRDNLRKELDEAIEHRIAWLKSRKKESFQIFGPKKKANNGDGEVEEEHVIEETKRKEKSSYTKKLLEPDHAQAYYYSVFSKKLGPISKQRKKEGEKYNKEHDALFNFVPQKAKFSLRTPEKAPLTPESAVVAGTGKKMLSNEEHREVRELLRTDSVLKQKRELEMQAKILQMTENTKKQLERKEKKKKKKKKKKKGNGMKNGNANGFKNEYVDEASQYREKVIAFLEEADTAEDTKYQDFQAKVDNLESPSAVARKLLERSRDRANFTNCDTAGLLDEFKRFCAN